MVAFDYAPFSGALPRVSRDRPPGGIGTTGLAMRSGRPMLVVPYAHDQPDNAARLARLGVARTVSPHRYNANRAAHELNALLNNPGYSERAAWVQKQIRAEDGIGCACDALETLMGTMMGQNRNC